MIFQALIFPFQNMLIDTHFQLTSDVFYPISGCSPNFKLRHYRTHAILGSDAVILDALVPLTEFRGGVRQNFTQAAAGLGFSCRVSRSLDTSQAWLSCQGQTIVGGSLGVEPVLPELVQAPAAMDATQCQNVFSSRLGPEHPGLFAAPANDGFAARFHHARTDEVPGLPEGAILHPADIGGEIVQGFLDRLRARTASALLAGFFDKPLDLVL